MSRTWLSSVCSKYFMATYALLHVQYHAFQPYLSSGGKSRDHRSILSGNKSKSWDNSDQSSGRTNISISFNSAAKKMLQVLLPENETLVKCCTIILYISVEGISYTWSLVFNLLCLVQVTYNGIWSCLSLLHYSHLPHSQKWNIWIVGKKCKYPSRWHC